MKKVLALFAVLFVFSAKNAVATHIQGVDITYKAIDSLKFEFTFNLYRDCRGIAMPTWPVFVRCLDKGISQSLGNMSSSTRTIEDVTPVCATQTSCASSPNQGGSSKGLEKHTYTMVLDFNSSPLDKFITGGCCWVRVETSQYARNGAITTGPSGAVYGYADINLCLAPTNNSPKFINQPISYLCCNQPAHISVGAADHQDFDSLSFSWSPPKKGYNSPTSYSGNFAYYKPLTVYYPGATKYPFNNPNANPPIGLFLDSTTGEIIFTPTKCDENTVAVIEVSEYRRINGQMKKIGTVMRDLQIEVAQCPKNIAPTIKLSSNDVFKPILCDSVVSFFLETKDIDPNSSNKLSTDSLRIIPELVPEGTTIELVDSSKKQPKVKVTWKPSREQRSEPRDVFFYLSVLDNACPFNGISQVAVKIVLEKDYGNTKVDVYNFNDVNENCKRDTLEEGLPKRYVQARLKKNNDFGFKYILNDTGYNQLCTDSGEYNVRMMRHPFYQDFCNDTTFDATADKVHQIQFGSQYLDQSIIGYVNNDGNENCKKDNSETGMNGVMITATPGPYYTTTDRYGKFLMPLPVGKYTISAAKKRAKETCSKTYIVDVKKDSIVKNNDFNMVFDSSNIALNCANRYFVRIGRSYYFHVLLRNQGTDTMKNVTINICHSPLLNISYSSLYTILNDSTIQIKTTALPKITTRFKIKYAPTTKFSLGDRINWESKIVAISDSTKDTYAGDNIAKSNSIIRGSYDPNIKETDEDSIITAFDSTLNYTIHFQNTGTAPAYYVELRDTLPEELLEGTFEFLGSSHDPVNYILQNRVLYFIFDDIELADSASNEEASKGFVKFKIKPKQGFIQDTSIRNNVSIYFDFNEPVKTADQVNTIKSPISVKPLSRPYYCAGDTVELSYFTRYFPESGNSFDFEISDENGDFSKGQVLKTISSAALQGKEVITIPKDYKAGKNYQFRMKGSHQWAITFQSDYSNAFEIVPDFSDTLVLTNTSPCVGSDVPLDLKQKKASKYRLFNNGNAIDSNATGYWSKLIVQAGDEVYIESSDNGKCPIASDTAVFNFHYSPKVELTMDTFQCGDLTLSVTNQSTSTDPIDQFDVFWGDGKTSDLKGQTNTTHLYTSTGSFDFKAVATTSFGCEDSVEYSVVIADQPEAKFTVPASICLVDSVSFSHTSAVASGSIDSVLWTTSNGSSIVDVFKEVMPADGVHAIQLIVGSDLGCYDTLLQNITAYENPDANFNITELSACFNTNAFEIDLTEGLSKYSITQQDWTYDGQTSTSSAQINHSFGASGDFEITLAIEDENGCTATDTQSIQVLDFLPATFDVNTLVQCLNSNDFTPTNYNDGSTFTNAIHGWEISDGGSYSTASFTHQFVAAGLYNIIHTTELDAFCKDTFEVEVTVNPNPEVDFSAVDVCEGEESVFVNESTSTVVVDDEQWDFDVSQENFNTAQTEVRNTFPSAGVYQVQCIQGALGCFDTSNISHTVNALPQISVDYEVVSTGIITVEFTNNSIGGGTETVWDFGDGTAPVTTTNKVVQHDYSVAGEYVITITETSPETCIQTAQITVDAIGEIIFLIPTAFSPNNDGFNDEFNIVDPNLIEALHIELFDRWGSKVAESDRKSDILRDADLTTGVYLYELKITDIFGMNHYHNGSIVVVE